MSYPPPPFVEKDQARLIEMIRAHPFAHFFTSGAQGPLVTRLPFAIDCRDGELTVLRAHMSASNPQVAELENGRALIAFSGPDSFVSPNWRTDRTRAATWDYEAVHVWGEIVRRTEREFFRQLINDLAAAAEVRFAGISDRSAWRIEDAPGEYVERLFPKIVPFEVRVTRLQGISKLHQNFSEEDASSVADHLSRAEAAGSREIAFRIRDRLKPDQST